MTDEQRTRIRDAQYLSKYGVGVQWYNEKLAQQGGVCAICHSLESQPHRKMLSIDHCHETGELRGLLCSRCNVIIGQANDDFALLRRASEYVIANRERAA